MEFVHELWSDWFSFSLRIIVYRHKCQLMHTCLQVTNWKCVLWFARKWFTCVICLFGDVWQWVFLIWIWKPAIDCPFQSYSFHSDKAANKSLYSGAIESIRVAFHYRFRFINNIYIHREGNAWVMLVLMNNTSKSNFSPLCPTTFSIPRPLSVKCVRKM